MPAGTAMKSGPATELEFACTHARGHGRRWPVRRRRGGQAARQGHGQAQQRRIQRGAAPGARRAGFLWQRGGGGGDTPVAERQGRPGRPKQARGQARVRLQQI